MAQRTRTLTIANGASQSDALELNTEKIIAIQLPDTWTAAALTFLASNDGTTYGPVYDDSGTEATIASANVVALRCVGVDVLAGVLAGFRYLKLRSGTAASPVNQGAARTILVGLA